MHSDTAADKIEIFVDNSSLFVLSRPASKTCLPITQFITHERETNEVSPRRDEMVLCVSVAYY